jgi:hypothetical protein
MGLNKEDGASMGAVIGGAGGGGMALRDLLVDAQRMSDIVDFDGLPVGKRGILKFMLQHGYAAPFAKAQAKRFGKRMAIGSAGGASIGAGVGGLAELLGLGGDDE